MPGRNRPAAQVRRDGLAAVLGPPLDHPAIRSTALIDVASGMVLATAGPRADPDPLADPELLGARHADLVRAAVALLGPSGDGADGDGTDVLVDAGPAGHHVVRVLPDPHGGHLALTAVVVGTRRVAERVRRRLRRVPAAALTAVPVPGEPWHGPAEGPRPFRVAGSSGPQPPPRQSQPQSQPQPAVRSWAPSGPPTDPAPGRRPGAFPLDHARPGAAPSAAPLLAPPPLLRPSGPGDSAAGRPVPAAADPAMALLPGVRAGGPPPGAGPARSPAAALEAPAPAVRRLRPVDPPGGRPPVAAPPPSGPVPPAALPPPTGPRALPPAALPPAPHPPADGGGR